MQVCLFFCQENPYPAVTMHRVQRTAENVLHRLPQSVFPHLDEVSVQLFIDHATAKLKTAPPVVKAELKGMVPSGPPLGEIANPVLSFKLVALIDMHNFVLILIKP